MYKERVSCARTIEPSLFVLWSFLLLKRWHNERIRFAGQKQLGDAGTPHDAIPDECLSKDRDVLLRFYDFPAEHWGHLRTTRTKGSGSRIACPELGRHSS